MEKIIGECYICFEETPLLSPCLCKNVFLCENCIVKLSMYNFKKCKVCNTDYPKSYETNIDINILLNDDTTHNDERTHNYSFTPCCLRPRSERGNPKYCLFDFFVHILCIYVIMIITSCSITPDSQCYGIDAVWYFLPSLLLYIMIAIVLSITRT